MSTYRLSEISGVTPEIQEMLEKAGISIPFLLAISPIEELLKTGLTKDEAEVLIRNARDQVETKFYTVKEFTSRIFDVSKITTGSRDLDDALEQSVQTMKTTEFYGPSGVGKTQICLQLSVNVQLDEEMGGLSSRAVYIDTEGSFTPKRISELASHKNLSPREALKNIYYTRADSVNKLFEVVVKAEKFLEAGSKLLIVDNIITPFRAEYDKFQVGRRQMLVQKLLWTLLGYADRHNVAVVFTNRVYSIPDPLAEEKFYPFGGLAVERSVHKKVLLRRHDKTIFRGHVEADGGRQFFFKIERGGLMDL